MTTYSARCALLRSYQVLSILTHNPRIIRTMRGTALLSGTEAALCIRDLKAGRQWSVEAVNAYGGTRKVSMLGNTAGFTCASEDGKR